MKHTLALFTALLLAPLAAPAEAPGEDVAARLAQRHLSATYCAARPEKQPTHLVAIHREIIPVAAPTSMTIQLIEP